MKQLISVFFTGALIAVAPGMASAQAFATSLSATFGPGGGASSGGRGDVSLSQITSLSMASASGTYAAAASVAGPAGTAALAGAAMAGELPPLLRVRPVAGATTGNMYETELFFGDPRSIPGYEQMLARQAE